MESTPKSDQEPLPAAALSPEPSGRVLAPIPSAFASSISKPASYLTLVPDERAIPRLLERLLELRGLTLSQAARQFGIRPGSLHQYLSGRRSPSLLWFLKFCVAMGARVEVKVTR